MIFRFRHFLIGICSIPTFSLAQLAETPPLGWNSFDSYGVYINEQQALQNLEAFINKLQPHGYEYFVLDAGWFGEFDYYPGTRYAREKHAKKLHINEYGLLQPSKQSFPNGLKKIIDKVHQKGLKFGLHLMRGIPRQAVDANTPIKGTSYFAQDIADKKNVCQWCTQNYGVNMDHPAAQEFYNSLINQLASWGVDFIKYDDIIPYPREVEAVVKAVAQAPRPILLSLSPGDHVPKTNIGTFAKANMLRITGDIWDDVHGLNACFNAWKKWQGTQHPNFWLDMDMIPFGELQISSPSDEIRQKLIKTGQMPKEDRNTTLFAGKGQHRRSQLTPDQMQTFITMRALAASPLMVGGALHSMDPYSLELLTNPDMMACNQNGVMGKLLEENNQIEVWQTPNNKNKGGWLGIFNRSDKEKPYTFSPEAYGISSPKFESVWQKKEIKAKSEHTIPPHGVIFVKYK